MPGRARLLGRLLLLAGAAAVILWLSQALRPAAEGGSGYRWIDHRHNDGDSFHVRTPDGDDQEIRLYFVDAPETALKRYANGDTNHERVADQARDLGLDREQTVEVGRRAREWVSGLLRDREFTVFTHGELVYGGPRVYGFVQVVHEGEERWLHELLVEQGLARIHTKGATLPDGTSRRAQTRRLRKLERVARHNKRGAWGPP